MKSSLLQNLICTALVLAVPIVSENPLVLVEQGWLQGEELELVTNDGTYFSFKGIPYAAPPIGNYRFRAPKAPSAWEDIRNATEHGSMCPHRDILTGVLYLGSEDCLFLNVYTPDLNPEIKAPVLFFIHGGGFKSGFGNTDSYGPDFLIPHGVVVVTINFRLGALGLLSLDNEDVPGNAALKDQVLALKWVQKNICNFGGDPDNVTIMGQSSGAATVGYHALSPMSKGLFKRIVALSGSPNANWALSYEPQRRAFNLAKDLGHYSSNTSDLLEFLQGVPHEDLIDVAPYVLSVENIGNYFIKEFQFTPVIEKDFGQERFILDDPLKSLESGVVNDVDMMIGHTNSEGSVGAAFYVQWFTEFDYYPELLVQRKSSLKCKPSVLLQMADAIRKYYFGDEQISNNTMAEFIKYVSDSAFNYDVLKFAEKFYETNRTTYLYQFSDFSDRNIYGANGLPYGVRGAGHFDDLMYLFFSNSANIFLIEGTPAYDMVKTFCSLITNYAKYGNPTPDNSLGAVWPEYETQNKYYLNIDEQITVGTDLNQEMYSFWQSIDDLYEQC